MAAAEESKLSLKLLIDTKNQRVLFGEADKNTIDFLFHILTLPMGTVIRLVNRQNMVGSLGNIYGSIENLSNTYIQKSQIKDVLLKPIIPHNPTTFSIPLLALPDKDEKENKATIKVSYGCSSRSYSQCFTYVSEDPLVRCPSCNNLMSLERISVPSPETNMEVDGGGGGYVKGVVTYMVMDDLVVMPMSTISGIALLNKLNVKEFGDLEERVVDLGYKETLNLLNACLGSKKVLTEVFLKNKGE